MSDPQQKIQSAHEQVNQIFYKALSGESSDACSGSTTGASHAAPAQKLRPNEQGDMVEDKPAALKGQAEIPLEVRLALLVILNHVEQGWENSVAVVRHWLGLP